MLKAERRAEVEWQGSLMQGSGTIVSVGSGALQNLPVTWASRTERSDGRTSPEELLAAAHASCFAMAFSHGLAQAGTTAERLHVNATCTFEQVEGGFKVSPWCLMSVVKFRDWTRQVLKKQPRLLDRAALFLMHFAIM